MRRHVRLLAALLLATVAGCSFAPVYKVPQSVPVPARYDGDANPTDRAAPDGPAAPDGSAAQDPAAASPSAGAARWTPSRPRDAEPRGEWWTVFDDSGLNALQQRVAGANQNLQAAFARLQQARDDTRIARADLFPTITAGGTFTRARASPYSPRFPLNAPTLGNDFDLEADFSYELDLWGRVRNQVASARANQQASAADLASVELALRAELATDYFNLRGYDQQQALLDRTLDDYVRARALTQNLFDEGAAAITDVAQAEVQLQTARAQAADVRLQRAQTEHAIAVLVGENPSTFHLVPNPLPLDVSPPPVTPGVPSGLLERRPDVAEAERRVAAANAQIGVARAAYFPQVNFMAAAGWNSINQSVFLDAPSRFWQFGPQITLPLFEGGRLRAQTDRTKAVLAEQVAAYRNTVLTAYQDVEDNLSALQQLGDESRAQIAAVLASGVALGQARVRYQEGLVTYLEVASTETTALQTQLTAITVQTRRMNASVLLVKALGGGWQR